LRFWLGIVAAFAVVAGARAAPTLEDFAATPRIEQIALSPSGDHFATIGLDGAKRLLTVRKADGTPEFAADLGGVEVDKIAWGGDTKLILLTRSLAGGGLTLVARQAFHSGVVIDIPTRNVRGVFKNSNSVLDAVFGWFGVHEIDGRTYVFLGGIASEKIAPQSEATTIYPDLYRVDLDTLAYTRVARAGANRTFWVLAPDGAIVGHGDYDARGKVQTIYGGAGTDRPLMSRATLEGKLSLDGLGRTADTMLIADRTSGEEVAREIRVSGPNDGVVLYASVEGDQALRDPKTNLLIGITARGELGGVRFTDPQLQARVVAAAKAFPGSRMALVGYTPGLSKMVTYTESAADSGTYWLVDIDKKAARPISAARPSIKAEDLGAVSIINYHASDGQALDGVLTLPPKSAGKGLPLVVLPHGGPYQLRDDKGLDLQAQAFASRGYAVFQPNYRGTLGYGEAFRKAADGEVGRKLQTDLSDGIAALAAQGVVDPKRVCIVGADYGAYAALAGVTLQQGVYRCAVGRQGIYDLQAYENLVRLMAPEDVRASAYKRSAMGPVAGEDLQEISPARRAAQADAPVMLIYDEDSEEGWVAQSRKMERSLKQAGKPVEVFVRPDPKSKAAQAQSPEDRAKALLTATVAFVEKYNPPN
jgi:dipeptidyl aminopeptidase/acylaminoacyl peptidase